MSRVQGIRVEHVVVPTSMWWIVVVDGHVKTLGLSDLDPGSIWIPSSKTLALCQTPLM